MTRTVEYVLSRKQVGHGHALGVNAVAHSENGILYSGGRDARILGWAPDPSSPDHHLTQAFSVEGHSNWVTGLQAVGDAVATCSYDTTVKIWDSNLTNSERLGHHTDYAKCLATGAPGTVISGAWDGHVMGWDVKKPGAIFDFHIKGDMGSVYAVAGAPDNSIIAAGAADSVVRLFDPRQPGRTVARLTGHTDNIRAVAIDGEWLYSGSSDTTIKQWSLTAGRLFKTFTTHSSSVWSLLAIPGSGTFYSGDRAGYVVEHSTAGASIICCAGQGVGDLAISENTLWAAAARPDLQGFSTAPQTEPLLDLSLPEKCEGETKPLQVLAGQVGLRKHRMLNDKRRVLTVDTAGDIGMVDILSGQELDFHAKVEGANADEQLDKILKEVNTLDVLDNWCRVRVKAGSLEVRLDERSCGNTEVYADDLAEVEEYGFGDIVIDDEKRVNLGQWALSNVLGPFIDAEVAKYKTATAAMPFKPETPKPKAPSATTSTSPNGSKPAEPEKKSRFRKLFGMGKKDDDSQQESTQEDTKPDNQQQQQQQQQASGADNATAKTGDADSDDEQDNAPAPATFEAAFKQIVDQRSLSLLETAPRVQLPLRTRLVVSEYGPGAGGATAVYTHEIGQMQDPKQIAYLEEDLPGWVAEIVLKNKLPKKFVSKIGFIVLPEQDDLPEVQTERTRLMAQPVLRARKIMAYTLKQLLQSGEISAEDAEKPPEQVVQLLCGDQILPPKMPLAVIRTRVWRSGGEVQLRYRLLPKA